MFSRRWLGLTLLAILAVGVMVRLGIWQLDRLEQRRAFNARVSAQLEAPPLELTSEALDLDLYAMEYRQVVVQGEYDHAQEVIHRNQVWGNQYGMHVYTPLVVAGTDSAILVNRGWLPADQAAPEERASYQEMGEVTVEGVIRRFMNEPKIAGVPDPTLTPEQQRLDAWNFIIYEKMQAQVDYPLLAVYVEQSPDEGRVELPYRVQSGVALDEGPHLGYALQWFSFAAILLVGYPFFVQKQTQDEMMIAQATIGEEFR